MVNWSLIQEYVEGQTLGDMLDQELPRPLVERIILQLIEVVAHAHKNRIMHRDIKPNNIIIQPNGNLKLLDFGAAKMLGEKEISATMVGSRPFMAPEQIMGQSERRSDIWAIGVLMYLLYTGELPFYSEVEKLLIDQILEQEPLPPREENPEIPPALEAIILKCLKKKLEERYPSAVALRDDLVAPVPPLRHPDREVAVDPLTHVATGVICSQLLPAPSRWWAAAAGAIFALLPDVDYFFIFWDRLAFIRYHRGFSHSLVALPFFALAGALLGRVLGGPRWFKPLFILGLAVLLSHLLLDLATSYGTQILSPFSRRRFALDWIFIIDPYFTALLVIGAIGALAFPLWGPRVGAWFLAAAGVYLLVCASYHHQALDLARQVFQDRQTWGADRGRPAPTLFLPPLAPHRRRPGVKSGRPLCNCPMRPPWGLRPRMAGGGRVRPPEPGRPGPGHPLPGARPPDHPDLDPGPGGSRRLFSGGRGHPGRVPGVCPVSPALPGSIPGGRTTAGVAGPALFRPRPGLPLCPATAPGRPRQAPALAHRAAGLRERAVSQCSG